MSQVRWDQEGESQRGWWHWGGQPDRGDRRVLEGDGAGMCPGEGLGEDAVWAAAGPGGQGEWVQTRAEGCKRQCGQGE